MADNDIALMAHLMRRAGFGVPRDELEAYVAKGYEATVEELLHPEDQPEVDLYLMERYLPGLVELQSFAANQHAWVYRMINTKRALLEKLALFWHGVLCHRPSQTWCRPDEQRLHRYVPPSWPG